MNFKELFVVRPCDTEGTEYMITFGNQLASIQKFKSAKAAQMAINKTDWNLVACLASVLIKAQQVEQTGGELVVETDKVKEGE